MTQPNPEAMVPEKVQPLTTFSVGVICVPVGAHVAICLQDGEEAYAMEPSVAREMAARLTLMAEHAEVHERECTCAH